MPGLLSILRFLLLALLALAPALALAQQPQMTWFGGSFPSEWNNRINDTAAGTLNLFNVHRNPNEVGTGLKLSQQSSCSNGGGMFYGLWGDTNNSNEDDYFSLRDNNGTLKGAMTSDVLTLTNTANQHVTLNFKANQSLSGELTLKLRVSIKGSCDSFENTIRIGPLTITLLANRNIRTAESLAAASVFRTDRLLSSSTAVTTGIVFQRGTMRCPTNMTLLNHTDYLRLQHLNPSSNALTGALATSHAGVAMGGSDARALALLFKAGATVSAGTLTVSLHVQSDASDNACPGAFAATVAATVTAQLAAVAANAWEIEDKDSVAASGSFAAPALAAASSPTPTGIRLHRSSTRCRLFDVALDSAAGTWLGLLRMTVSGGSTAAVGAQGRSFTGVHMEDGDADDNHFRLVFSARANVGARARVERATVEVTPSTTCAASDRPANPLTLSYAVTIRAGYREVGSNETLRAASVMMINELAASATAVTTGIKFQRGLAACPNTSMRLLNHTGYLRLQPVNASGVLSGSAAVSHANVPMFSAVAANNRALALLFAPRAAAAAGTLAVRVLAESDTTQTGCAGLLASTITALVTLADPTAWQAGPKARSQAASVLLTTEIGAGADTGIRFSHFTAACADSRLVLSERTVTGSDGTAQARSIARFSRYTAADAREPGHVGFDITVANVPGNAYARLEMIGAPPVGTLTLQAVARPACSPVPPGVEPLTLSYVVTLADPTAWQAGSRSRPQALSVMLASEVTLQPDTGIRFHHYTIACDRVRLMLTGSAATIARFQPYTAADVKRGTPGSDIMLANPLSGVHAGLELRGAPPAGTLTFTAEATAACPSVTGIKPLTLSYQVTVVDASGAEQAAVGQATGAAVTRVVGMRGIDAVLRRAAGSIASEQSLLGLLAAKEQQLESGEIDLRGLLAGQEFALGLDASASGRPGLGAWGRAEFLQLEDGEDSDPLRHEGDMFSAQVGADYRLAGGALFGVGYGRHQLDTDYNGGTSDSNAYAGNYVLELDVAQPYASLPLEGGHLAGAVAVGSGEAELKDADADAGTAYDADYLGWALGYREAASDSLEIEGAFSGGSLDIPDLGPDGSKADNMSLRAGVRYAPDLAMGGGSLQPSAGVAVAVDWGDDPGHKYELSAGLGYASQRLAVAAEYLFIGMDEGDLTASGGSIDVRFSTAPGNLGLGLAATPAHGPAAGADLLAQPEAGMRGAAEIGYGLAVDGGVLTPYGGWSFATEAGEVGLRLRHGDGGSWLLRWRQDERDMIAVEFNLLGD